MPKITFDSDEEFAFDEDLDTTKTIETTQDTSDEDSDDDAMPEAVSIRSSRDQATSQAKAEKEAALNLAKADKEKRRLRDLQLKQQKQGSRRELKKQQKQQTPADSDSEENDLEEDADKDNQRLPQDILDALAETSPAGSKRTHMTMADFEAVQAEYEAQVEQQLEAQRKKQKKAEKGRQVGEYTVKVLNQRPRVAKTGKSLRNMVNSKLHRKANERENAILQRSSGRFGSSALVFRRPDAAKSGKK